MSGNGARVLGRDGLRGERDSAEATLKAMRSDKFEWLASAYCDGGRARDDRGRATRSRI